MHGDSSVGWLPATKRHRESGRALFIGQHRVRPVDPEPFQRVWPVATGLLQWQAIETVRPRSARRSRHRSQQRAHSHRVRSRSRRASREYSRRTRRHADRWSCRSCRGCRGQRVSSAPRLRAVPSVTAWRRAKSSRASASSSRIGRSRMGIAFRFRGRGRQRPD